MPFHLADSRAITDASILLATFGAMAPDEAATRAHAARRVGNHILFCHWRQIERLLEWLGSDTAIGTIH
jgi:hypothetical protein